VVVKTDTGIITVTVEHHSGGFTASFPRNFQRFDVSLLSGENDIAQPQVSLRTDREQQQGKPNACLSRVE
jgi:hypothetical protein